MKKRIIALILSSAMLLSLVGCGSKEETPDEGQGKEPAVEQVIDKDTLVVTTTSVDNTLDATEANSVNATVVAQHIYDMIIDVDDNFNFIPAVATEWEYVDDTTFKFTVGEGYMFSNGEPLEMEDIVYSITRCADIAKRTSVMNNIKSVEAISDNEISITLNEVDSSTIRDLMGFVFVVDKSYCESNPNAFTTEPIGTGPYAVTNFVPGDKVELKVWDAYPFEKPQIPNVVFKGVGEAANRYISLETGEAQFARIVYQDVERAKENSNVLVEEVKTTSTSFISMNTTKAPFDNENVRLAMAYACDTASLALVEGGATPIDSMVPSMFSIYNSSEFAPKFDLEKARQLLEAEGYDASNPLEFEAWVYNGKTNIMETYQALLQSINVKMTITNLEFGVFLEGMANAEYQMLGGSWSNTTGNELSALENYWSGSFGNQNISFFESARVDELYQEAKATTDPVRMREIAIEVQDIAAKGMPIIPTYSSPEYYAMSTSLKGVDLGTNSLFSLRGAYYE